MRQGLETDKRALTTGTGSLMSRRPGGMLGTTDKEDTDENLEILPTAQTLPVAFDLPRVYDQHGNVILDKLLPEPAEPELVEEKRFTKFKRRKGESKKDARERNKATRSGAWNRAAVEIENEERTKKHESEKKAVKLHNEAVRAETVRREVPTQKQARRIARRTTAAKRTQLEGIHGKTGAKKKRKVTPELEPVVPTTL